MCIIKVYDLNIGAVRNVFSRHHYARSDVEAAIFCSKAGCDWNCGMVILNCQGIKLMIHTLRIYYYVDVVGILGRERESVVILHTIRQKMYDRAFLFHYNDSIIQLILSIMHTGSEFGQLYDAVQEGLIDEKFINVSVSRLIKAMLKMGVLDPPEKVNFSQ